jgi:DMSO/TMAO reductase YedYZ molybdopterin-dependent catalytic subunit
MRSEKSSIAGMTRRVFLQLTGGMTLMASIPSTAESSNIKVLPIRTVEKNKFKFDAVKGLIEWEKEKEPYRLIVDGLVQKPRSFSYAEIKSFSPAEQMSDFHCVEGWSLQDLKWGGFRFKEIVSKIEPNKVATHVLFHSFGITESSPKGQTHYIESFPLSELLDPGREIIMALTADNRPLPEEHGGPLRLIAPYDLAYKSIKFVSRIEFVQGERPGWWTLANPIYPTVARVPASRLRRK